MSRCFAFMVLLSKWVIAIKLYVHYCFRNLSKVYAQNDRTEASKLYVGAYAHSSLIIKVMILPNIHPYHIYLIDVYLYIGNCITRITYAVIKLNLMVTPMSGSRAFKP